MQFFIVHGGFWKDPWVLDLTAPGKLLWSILTTYHDSDNGFILASSKELSFYSDLPREDVESLLTEFETAGRIMRSGGMILVVKHLTHRRLSENNLIGAANRIRQNFGAKYPELVARCWQANDLDNELEAAHAAIAARKQPRTDRVATPSEPRTDPVGDGDDTSVIKDQISGIKQQNQEQKEEKKGGLSPAALDMMPVAGRIVLLIEEHCTNHGIPKPVNCTIENAAVALDQLQRIEGAAASDVELTVGWALDDDFWQGLLLSPDCWRKKSANNGLKKMQNANMARIKDGRQPGNGVPARSPYRKFAGLDANGEQLYEDAP